jgi:hypothetical protein
VAQDGKSAMSGRCLYFFPANECIEAGTAQLVKHCDYTHHQECIFSCFLETKPSIPAPTQLHPSASHRCSRSRSTPTLFFGQSAPAPTQPVTRAAPTQLKARAKRARARQRPTQHQRQLQHQTFCLLLDYGALRPLLSPRVTLQASSPDENESSSQLFYYLVTRAYFINSVSA